MTPTALSLLTVRQLQVLLLVLMLLGGSASKAARVIRTGSISAGLGSTGLFPWRLRRHIMIMTCVFELALGLALVATAGRPGTGAPATITRASTALFFLVAIGTLYEMRQHRPAAGCGCFGDLSETPIGLRTMTRACLLCLAAVVSIGAPALTMPGSPRAAGSFIGVLALELILIAVLSPEVAEIGVRLGYSEPCELRRVPVARTLAALKHSSQWRRHASQIATSRPTDIWREGCWRFVVFRGSAHGRPADIIFAVYLQPHRPPIRVAVVDIGLT